MEKYIYFFHFTEDEVSCYSWWIAVSVYALVVPQQITIFSWKLWRLSFPVLSFDSMVIQWVQIISLEKTSLYNMLGHHGVTGIWSGGKWIWNFMLQWVTKSATVHVQTYFVWNMSFRQIFSQLLKLDEPLLQ